MTRFVNVGIFIREKVWLANGKEGDRIVAGPSTEAGCEG